jgi:hypothetical protein
VVVQAQVLQEERQVVVEKRKMRGQNHNTPGPFVSRRVTHIESMKACTIYMVLSHMSSFRSCTPWRIKLVVISSFHSAHTVLCTRLGSMVRRLEIENMNDGLFMGGVVIWNVMPEEAQTVCWVRICMCTGLRL